MANQLNDKQPIYIQIRQLLENMILKGQLNEGDQTPSTAQLSEFYKINHITVNKGVNQLVDDGILLKRRGVGVFVAEGAKESLIEKRRQEFKNTYVLPLLNEASSLNISLDELIHIIEEHHSQGGES